MPQNPHDLPKDKDKDKDKDGKDKAKGTRVRGPFWFADADVIQLVDPRENSAFRSLFVDNTLRQVGGDKNLLLPGTLLALCYIRGVQIRPTDESQPVYAWKRGPGDKPPKMPSGALTSQVLRQLLSSGQLSLLLVQANPEEWRTPAGKDLPELTCLAGDINLDVLNADGDARDRLYGALTLAQTPLGDRSGPARLPGAISVHASGLSIYGSIRLPWQEEQERISAPFQLAQLIPDSTGQRPEYRLTVEAERLTQPEKDHIVETWGDLSKAVNPGHPLNGLGNAAPESPAWVTLEIADPRRLPRLYWPVASWQERPEPLPLRFEPGEIGLLISDQQPYDLQRPPTSLARAALESVVVTLDQGELRISASLGPDSVPADGRLSYEAKLDDDGAWEEDWVLADVDIAFSAVETPRFLRESQGLPVPEWSPGDQDRDANTRPIEPPILWGFMPLADGWAQLPVPDLTEQIYLDADLIQAGEEQQQRTLLQGAVSFGNNRADVLALHREEQPWNLMLTDVGGLRGQWRMTMDPDTGSASLVGVMLEIDSPELTVNGLLWLSTKRPTEANALPDLEDWVGGLRSVPLASARPGSGSFPPVVTTPIKDLEFSLRRTTEFPSALLQAWSFVYGADAETLGRMVEKAVLPPDTFGRFRPLVWRRHPTLPMVQALPLTQSQSPPNHPSASRQLAPFELATSSTDGERGIPVPVNWRFGVSGSGGAADWPVLLDEGSAPAQEWRSLFDMPMAALSIPGLVLDLRATPSTTGLDPGAAVFLPPQYRFDLPYTDEFNALAQLPKVPRGLEGIPPAPGSPPEKARPLTRETFDEHWRRLAERASLAAADAVTAFYAGADVPLVRHLIEPFDWPVRPAFELEQYPGTLVLSNEDQPEALVTELEDPLKGITGRFVEDGDGRIKRAAEDEDSEAYYKVEAGSMVARRVAGGAYRDQRGLHRSPTATSAKLTKTPVRLHEHDTAYELASALAPFPLHAGFDARLGGEQVWRLWMRDLPVRSGVFDRAQVRSARAQDINDPEAASRELNYLTGYEWRMELGTAEHLSLFGLHFYPLTLEKVVVGVDRLERVEIIGRLQLPLEPSEENEEVTNAVRVTFERETGQEEMALTAVALESEVGEWPLALHGGEVAEAPRLRWRQIALGNDRDRVEVDEVELGFFLFDAEWTVPLDRITFEGRATAIEHTYAAQPDDADDPLTPAEVTLRIDLEDLLHEVSLLLAVRLGNNVASTSSEPRLRLLWRRGQAAPGTSSRASATAERSTFRAGVRFYLLGARVGELACETASLFDDIELPGEGSDGAVQVSHTPNALQFSWQRYREPEQGGRTTPTFSCCRGCT